MGPCHRQDVEQDGRVSIVRPSPKPFAMNYDEPSWDLMGCRHLTELPAVQWKLRGLTRPKEANPAKFRLQTDELQQEFSGFPHRSYNSLRSLI